MLKPWVPLGPSLGLGTYHSSSAGYPESHRDPYVSTYLALGMQACVTTSAFLYCGYRPSCLSSKRFAYWAPSPACDVVSNVSWLGWCRILWLAWNSLSPCVFRLFGPMPGKAEVFLDQCLVWVALGAVDGENKSSCDLLCPATSIGWYSLTSVCGRVTSWAGKC